MILLRGGEQGLELLLVKRNPAARFMGGAWVFPGGAVDAHEGEGDEAHRVAACASSTRRPAIARRRPARAGQVLALDHPREVKIRFDTHFFLAPAPGRRGGRRSTAQEIVDHGWFTPQGALDAHGRGEILLVFPTIKHLEQLGGFADGGRAARLCPRARGRARAAARGRVRRDRAVLLPGEPGYDG